MPLLTTSIPVREWIYFFFFQILWSGSDGKNQNWTATKWWYGSNKPRKLRLVNHKRTPATKQKYQRIRRFPHPRVKRLQVPAIRQITNFESQTVLVAINRVRIRPQITVWIQYCRLTPQPTLPIPWHLFRTRHLYQPSHSIAHLFRQVA